MELTCSTELPAPQAVSIQNVLLQDINLNKILAKQLGKDAYRFISQLNSKKI